MILCQVVSVNRLRGVGAISLTGRDEFPSRPKFRDAPEGVPTKKREMFCLALAPLLLDCERVLFRRSFGQRVIVGRKIDCVEAIAFGVAVKKIALT
jgi:hypothetical protein